MATRQIHRKTVLCAVLVTFCILRSAAQSWELGVSAGGTGYLGDLNQKEVYKLSDVALGGFVKRNFDGYWSLKAGFISGDVAANDAASDFAEHRSRNLNFSSNISEISLHAEFNFFRYIPSLSRKRYSPYIFAGGGLVFFDPKTKYNGSVYRLATFRTEGQEKPYRRHAFSVPYGAGIKYNFLGKWSIGGELGYRTAFTDYLDDVSGAYMDSQSWEPLRAALADRSAEAGYTANRPGTQRGDGRKRDTYFFAGISLSFTFLPCKCPPVY